MKELAIFFILKCKRHCLNFIVQHASIPTQTNFSFCGILEDWLIFYILKHNSSFAVTLRTHF